jgi:hypothetical protein
MRNIPAWFVFIKSSALELELITQTFLAAKNAEVAKVVERARG